MERLLLAVFLGLGFVVFFGPFDLLGPTKWEYDIQAPKDASIVRDLNKLGQQGWEVVSARRATDAGSSAASYEVILKRRAPMFSK